MFSFKYYIDIDINFKNNDKINYNKLEYEILI